MNREGETIIMKSKHDSVRSMVKSAYGKVAKKSSTCCSSSSCCSARTTSQL